MCQDATGRRAGFLAAATCLVFAVLLPAQPSASGFGGLRPDWRRIGTSAYEFYLASPATGPVDRVWFSSDGARLFARTRSGRYFESEESGGWKSTLVLTAPVHGVFTVPVDGRPITRLTANGLLQPWDHVSGDAVGYEANALVGEMSRVAYRTVDGWGDTDCLFVGEPVTGYLELFRAYERLMADRVGPAPRDWETVQREFAQARSHGDFEGAAALERELRLLRLASLTSGEMED